MKLMPFVFLAFLSAAESEAAPDLTALDFLIGSWDAGFETFAATWGEEGAGVSTGSVEAWFGEGRKWLEIEARTTIPRMGDYVVKTIVHGSGGNGGLNAYAVNTSGHGARYEGRRVSEGVFRFEADFGEVKQRITYEALHDGRVRYSADESTDGGRTYLPHSEGLWVRRAPPGSDRTPS